MNRLTIGQLAEKTHTTRRALRLYEKVGLLIPERDLNGYRRYTEDHISQVAFIRGMRAIGCPLKDLVALFQIKRSSLPMPEKFEHILEILDQGKDRLVNQQQEIETTLRRLEEFRKQLLTMIAEAKER